MKKMLFFLALIVSTNLFGQNGIYQPISKPSNKGCYGLYFNEDSTISFDNFRYIIFEKQLPELIKIFEKADKLSEYCQYNAGVEISRIIDTLHINTYDYFLYKLTEKDVVFTFEFTKTGSQLRIKTIEREAGGFALITPYQSKFVWILTTKRDEYYRALTAYYKRQKEVQNELDVILNK